MPFPPPIQIFQRRSQPKFYGRLWIGIDDRKKNENDQENHQGNHQGNQEKDLFENNEEYHEFMAALTLLFLSGKQHCRNCGANETPQWRWGMTLCNPCGLRYSKGQCCSGCQYVYCANDLELEPWTRCIYCDRPIHSVCAHLCLCCDDIDEDYDSYPSSVDSCLVCSREK
jgi:hypothetical protein